MSPAPPPRVLHIGKYFPPVAGGVETFLADLLAASHRAGISVAALIHQPNGAASQTDAFPYTLFRVPAYGQLMYAPVSPGLPQALARAIRIFQPNLLHLHCPNASAFAALALPGARRLPWVIHWHADVVASKIDRRLAWLYPLYQPLERRLLRRAAVVVVTSEAYLAASAMLTEFQDRCEVIPLGIDPARLQEPDDATRAWADSQWSMAGLRLLAIGRLAYYKGFDVLLKAVAAIPDCTLVIAGEGPRRAALETLTRHLSLQDRVRLTGYVPEIRLQALLAECDILCLPSVERTEAFGMVLLEAMRYARPVIASDIPGSGVGWVVHEGGHGVLVPVDDSDALADAIRRLQVDPNWREALGRTGIRKLDECFHIDHVVHALEVLYRQQLTLRYQ